MNGHSQLCMWTSKQWFPKSDQYHFLKFGFLIESNLRTDEINIVRQIILNHKSCILDVDIKTRLYQDCLRYKKD